MSLSDFTPDAVRRKIQEEYVAVGEPLGPDKWALWAVGEMPLRVAADVEVNRLRALCSPDAFPLLVGALPPINEPREREGAAWYLAHLLAAGHTPERALEHWRNGTPVPAAEKEAMKRYQSAGDLAALSDALLRIGRPRTP